MSVCVYVCVCACVRSASNLGFLFMGSRAEGSVCLDAKNTPACGEPGNTFVSVHVQLINALVVVLALLGIGCHI